MTTTQENRRDLGLLAIRLGVGAMFLWHGWPKISGGEKTWRKLGKAMEIFGIDQYPEIWGFLAAFAEFGGGLMLILGVMVRPAAALLAATMFVALSMHLDRGDGLGGAAHAIEAFSVFVGLLLMGGGRHSLDHHWFARS